MYLPFFPLQLVAFPGEALNLHIFEPRYRQLIADVEADDLIFGICTYTGELSGYGTAVRLEDLTTRYEDGRLDIKTRGIQAFKIISFDNPMPGKLYAGGEIAYLPTNPRIGSALQYEFVFYLKEVLFLLDYPHEVDPETVTSFSYAHKVGLSLEEELALVQLVSEEERAIFLIQHFKRMIPAMKAIQQAKEKIKLNGHFKHLDPLNF
jgi:hypothetical protein